MIYTMLNYLTFNSFKSLLNIIFLLISIFKQDRRIPRYEKWYKRDDKASFNHLLFSFTLYNLRIYKNLIIFWSTIQRTSIIIHPLKYINITINKKHPIQPLYLIRSKITHFMKSSCFFHHNNLLKNLLIIW